MRLLYIGQVLDENIASVIGVLVNMSFSEKVRYARQQLGLTQMQFAKVLGVSFATVNRWENDQVNPSSLAQRAFEDYCESSFISFPAE